MARTVPEAFQEFRSNLEITDLQEQTVSTRQQAVRKAVENGLEVRDSFLTGSYSRHTMIAPLKEADIDVFIVLAVKYYHHYNGQNGGQAGLLDLVKRTLQRTYPKTPDISRNGQAVTIRFADFVVDVVPGFYRDGGGYLIPNSTTQSWISTDPKAHVEIMATANRQHDGKLVPLVKMIKAWNKTIGDHFRSFHLEVLALQILENVQISDFPSGLRYFFGKAVTHITQTNPDPARYGGDVGYYLKTPDGISDAISRFTTAYNRALNAEKYGHASNAAMAISEWKKIFGDYFPSYG